MKYSLCASFKAALHEPVLFRGAFDEAFFYARELGFGGVELHIRDTKELQKATLLNASHETGVQLSCISTGLAYRVDGLSLTSEDSENRQQAIQRVKEHLDFADAFGCKVLLGSMRGNLQFAEDTATYQRFLQSMQELAHYIDQKNCAIVLEAINRYENNYLNCAEKTIEFLRQVGSPKVKLLLDTFHMNMEETDALLALRHAGEWLGHFHVADNTRLYPGSGQINFAALLRTLEDIHYDGWVSVECLSVPDERTAAQKALHYLKTLEVSSL
ncbi:MAG: TIM barrel protein [Oscillospiraceae bacterium]